MSTFYSLDKSKALLSRGRATDALLEARPNTVFSDATRIGGFPVFVEKASGPYIWDVDGHRYVDLILGYGSVVLGHADLDVSDAVIRGTLQTGPNPTLLTRHQLTLAEQITAVCPGVESVAFFKTGSDATSAAIRLARAVTQRKHVIRWGLNGWHDWCAPVTKGVPREIQHATSMLRYNDLEHARALFATHAGDIACAILMPYELDPPEAGFLEGLRDLCHTNGALFILDEIRSGFRVSIGGAQEAFGLEADLVTYGKAMGNGYPISALGGKASFMKHIGDVGVTVTFLRGPDAMIASTTTIAKLVSGNVPKKLRIFGDQLKARLDEAARVAGVPARVIGFPATPFIRFDYGNDRRSQLALQAFCNAMLPRGILCTPAHHWFLCAAMSTSDMEHVISAAKESFMEIAAA